MLKIIFLKKKIETIMENALRVEWGLYKTLETIIRLIAGCLETQLRLIL